MFVRLGRSAVDTVNSEDYVFEIGKGSVLREGKDITLIATGMMVQQALLAANTLNEQGIDVSVINIHTIKPLDEELIIAAAKETGRIVTVEEHSVIGGLGSAVCDALCAKYPAPVCKIGMYDMFGESGSAGALVKKYGLDTDGVYAKVKEFIK